MSTEPEEFHPIELAAHSILSGSLDTLNENFEELHQSQHILLTRLKLLEKRIGAVLLKVEAQSDLGKVVVRIRLLRKQLDDVARVLERVEQRLA